MVPLNQLTTDLILSDEILTEVFEQDDEFCREKLLMSLEDRASELGVKTKFVKLVKVKARFEREKKREQAEKEKALKRQQREEDRKKSEEEREYKRKQREEEKEKKRKQREEEQEEKRRQKEEAREKAKELSLLENWTNFADCPYGNMQCSSWIATDDGIFYHNYEPWMGDTLVCYHPIIPVERLKNIETGKEFIKLAYKRNGAWIELTVPKGVITSSSKIVALSELGVSVTSENSKAIVKFLNDVENLNDDHINIKYSSGKLGWINGDFLPYDTEIIFDGTSKFMQQYNSIKPHGDKNIWYDHVKKLRKTGRMEIKFMLASSFASILIAKLGGLPFFVDLWGETEGGKTVSLMLAASVWANPGENCYIGDYKSTDVALETKANMLNNLPMILDDTSKASERIRANFENVVYELCSGKGKSRSNKDLGINTENHWALAILTNGERPLQNYVSQGGAINRILEVECGEKIYAEPQKTVSILKKNYGFAGKDFVDVIKNMEAEEILKIQQDIQRALFSDSKMQKQSISLSIVLTADKIATERLFNDGQYIPMAEAKKTLVDRNEVSDSIRCYNFIVDKIMMNDQKFDYDTHCEKWGRIDLVDKEKVAVLYDTAFKGLCAEGGYSDKTFLSWAKKKGLTLTDKGRKKKNARFGDKVNTCIFLKLNGLPEEESEECDDCEVTFD